MALSRWFICFLLGAGCLLAACRQRAKSISFYYWKTSFHLDTLEKQVLQENAVQTIFTRYFDVDFLPADSSPVAVAPIKFDSPGITYSIIPVVYIKNRTFERINNTNIAGLVQKIYTLVSAINHSILQQPNEIQFDCDWTETTRNNYFLFLQQYKTLSKQIISATIRLHQVKYPVRTGIPPVNNGVLMYYNMGAIDGGAASSIYDKSIAAKYNTYIKTYPLALALAMPVFGWSLQVRDGNVVKLLNKMNFLHFENDTNFINTGNGRYVVKHACFHGGYYFKEMDAIKPEHVPEADLLDIVKQVNQNSNQRIRNIIFYDLDKENLVLYEKDIFRQVLDHLD